MLTDTEYTAARAICDKAQTYWETHATYGKGGCSSMSKELSAHPDYATATNELKGAVEEYELNRDKPERFSAYVVLDKAKPGQWVVTTWPGNVVGAVLWRKLGQKRDTVAVRAAWGGLYQGFQSHDADCINLRRVKS